MPTIYYRDVPSLANENATVDVDDTNWPLWDGDLYTERESVRYATLEPGYWVLDGKSRLLPKSYGKAYAKLSYCNDTASNDDGDIEGETYGPSVITIDLDNQYSATGLTFVFDSAAEEYCTKLHAAWYRGTTLLADSYIYPDSYQYTYSQMVEAFDKVVLTFYSTSTPHRFLRIERLLIGKLEVFTGEELQEVELHQEVDPSGTEMPGATASFTLRDIKHRVLYFQQRQPLEFWQGSEYLGTLYVDSSEKTAQYLYEISCIDAIQILADSTTDGGMYTNKSFKTLVQEIVNDDFEVEFDEALTDTTLTGWIPNTDKREALMQACFAAGAYATTAGTAKIRIATILGMSNAVVPKNRIMQGGKVTTDALITGVSINSHRYVEGTDEDNVYKDDLEPGTYSVVNSEPYTGYAITGGTITTSSPNSVSFTVSTTGEVVITGRKYIDYSTVRSQRAATVTAQDTSNAKTIEDATLISPDILGSTVQRLSEYCTNRQKLEQSIVYAGEQPGQLIVIEKPFDGQLIGYITERTLHLTGKAVAELVVQGRNVDLDTAAPQSGTVNSGEVW